VTGPRLGLSADAGELATALDRLEDFRVLRRMVPMERRIPRGSCADALSGVAIDVETTGLDHRRDVIIELAMRPFLVDAEFRIVDVGEAFSWFEDPGFPLTPEISALTRIDDAMVRGRSIHDGTAGSLLLAADFVVAHNSAFDRPFLERRLPEAVGRPWICSMREIDWRSHGFEGRSLGHLLLQRGLFFAAHRAHVDVDALLHLLDLRFEDTGETALQEALRRGALPTFVVRAVDAPFCAKDLLKARGYRWAADRRHWWREVGEEELDAEVRWAEAEVYAGDGTPEVARIDWSIRYAG
jgi:DNA polymerase-3 subunit epsilon